MPAKRVFTDEQQAVLHSTALRVWKRFKADGKTQEEMALAIGVSQQSVSDLLKGSYRPGYRPAKMLANLDGKRLEDLLEDFDEPVPETSSGPPGRNGMGFVNLDTCIQFYAASKQWSAWTIAAARAGYFGNADFAPPEWAGKLDALEQLLNKARKTA